MRKWSNFVILCLSLWILFTASPGQGQWVSIGPEGGKMDCVVQDPVNTQILYGIPTGWPTRILKSTDLGDSWSVISETSHGTDVIAIDPNTPSNLLMGGGRYILTSTNSGLSWTSKWHSGCIFDLLQIDDQPGLVHACGKTYDSTWLTYYHRSTNGGSTWSSHQVTDTYLIPRSLGVDPAHPDTVYIVGYSFPNTSEARVFKSTNGGTSWSDISAGISGSTYDIAIDSVNDRVYVGSMSGIYRSTNGGTSWTRNNGVAFAYSLAIDRNNPDRLYAAYANKVYRSTDKGKNFTAYSSGLYGETCHQILVDHGSSSNVFTLNFAGFFKSTDGGKNWNACVAGYCASDIEAVCVHPASPNMLYAAYDNNSVYKTTNALGKTENPAEVTWERLPAFYACHNIADFEFGSQNPNVVYALEGGG